MLFTILAYAVLGFLAIVAVGLCLLPLTMLSGVKAWFKASSLDKDIQRTDALLREAESLQAQARKLQARVNA